MTTLANFGLGFGFGFGYRSEFGGPNQVEMAVASRTRSAKTRAASLVKMQCGRVRRLVVFRRRRCSASDTPVLDYDAQFALALAQRRPISRASIEVQLDNRGCAIFSRTLRAS